MVDTRRDIIEKVEELSHDNANLALAMRSYYKDDPAVDGALKDYVTVVNANVATITAAMTAFAAAAP